MQEAVRAWFDRRTFAADDFPPERLVRAKGGRTVSVVLPARDEEATVGEIVRALRAELMTTTSLVDEVVVIDSDSRDRTAEVARAAGATVWAASEILPELGSVPGKGEALWSSLAVTTGDLVVFLDSDVSDFSCATVCGLLGPLLTEPGVRLVKGCFDRPLADGHTVLPSGGGRVTELAARPLLAAHRPELSGVVQPLAGEFAAPREVLESLSFAPGYGVDIGILLDVHAAGGLDALAQVDLGVRRHRNSPDAALSAMALQIQGAVFRRLGALGVARDGTGVPRDGAGDSRDGAVGDELTRFERDGEGGDFRPTTVRVPSAERPPMAWVRARASGGSVAVPSPGGPVAG